MPYLPVNFLPFLATPVIGMVMSGPASVAAGMPPALVAAPAVGAPKAASARLATIAAKMMRTRISPPTWVGVPEWSARFRVGLRFQSSRVDARPLRATLGGG